MQLRARNQSNLKGSTLQKIQAFGKNTSLLNRDAKR